jgi:hypothetical protein
LPALGVALAGVGIVLGSRLGRRYGDPRDLIAAGFAGGSLGLLLAAVVFAAIRSVERPLGAWAASPWAVLLLWAAIGAVVARLSIWIFPYRPDHTEAPS